MHILPGRIARRFAERRQRIVQRDELAASVPQIGKVPCFHASVGTLPCAFRRSGSRALLGEEEECAIFAVIETGNRDWAADCSTELVSLKGSAWDTIPIVSPTIRVKLAVAKKLEKRSVEFVLPDRVATLMTPPPVRPYSAASALLMTLNSATLSTIGV